MRSKAGSDEISWARHRQLRQDWLERRLWERRIPGGESFFDLQARFVPFIEKLVEEARPSPGVYTASAIVLVGHGGLFVTMLPLMLDNVDLAFAVSRPFPNTGYVLAEVCEDATRQRWFLHCLEWCGVFSNSGARHI